MVTPLHGRFALDGARAVLLDELTTPFVRSDALLGLQEDAVFVERVHEEGHVLGGPWREFAFVIGLIDEEDEGDVLEQVEVRRVGGRWFAAGSVERATATLDRIAVERPVGAPAWRD